MKNNIVSILLAIIISFFSFFLGWELGKLILTNYNKVEEEVQVVNMEVIPTQEKVQEFTYLGEYKITYYCPCELCCGAWALNRPNGIVYTASGNKAKEGVTIACSDDIAFDTKVKIVFEDGTTNIYTCHDRGGAIQGKRIDIYLNDHNECLKKGVDYGKIFVLSK